MRKTNTYYVYIITNLYKTVNYVGVTNNLKRRLQEHTNGSIVSFSTRYKCKYLVYYEKYADILIAIAREKEIKKWGKRKKTILIEKQNPEWDFLNESIMITDDEYLWNGCNIQYSYRWVFFLLVTDFIDCIFINESHANMRPRGFLPSLLHFVSCLRSKWQFINFI